jgi:hypothetical protein
VGRLEEVEPRCMTGKRLEPIYIHTSSLEIFRLLALSLLISYIYIYI